MKRVLPTTALVCAVSLSFTMPALAWNAGSDEMRRQMTINQMNKDAAKWAERSSQPFFGGGRYSPSSSSPSTAASSNRAASPSSGSGLDETFAAFSASLARYEAERRKEVTEVTTYTVTRKESPQALAGRIRAGADAGDVFAQWTLGRMYNSGVGVGKNATQAVKWFRAAAEKGDADGQASLGDMYYSGSGVSKDAATAVEWWSKAAEQGHAIAAKNAGASYQNGWGVTVSKEKARDLYKIAATAGDPQAALWLAELYDSDALGKPDKAAACPMYKIAAQQGMHAGEDGYSECFHDDAATTIAWLRKSADGGHPRAKFKLGMAILNGIGTPKDEAAGAKMVIDSALPAVESTGDTKALMMAGTLHLNGRGVPKNVLEALRFYRMAMDRNDPKGRQALDEVIDKLQAGKFADDLFNKGFDFLEGAGVPKDPKRGFQILKEAAEAGNLGAFVALAGLYHDGVGTKPDLAQAAYLRHTGALLGLRQSKREWGISRCNGDGVAKDGPDGFTWLKQAAADDDLVAHAVLGEVYETGDCGESKDLAKARAEFQLAADAGNESAKKALQRLSK